MFQFLFQWYFVKHLQNSDKLFFYHFYSKNVFLENRNFPAVWDFLESNDTKEIDSCYACQQNISERGVVYMPLFSSYLYRP